LLLVSELPAQARHEYSEVHMGMPVRIVVYAPSDSAARFAVRSAFQRIAELDADLNDYRADSELRRIEQGAGQWVTVKATTLHVLGRALEIARLSDGAFDPSVGPVVRLWRQARVTKQLPDPDELAKARRLVGHQHVRLDRARSAVRLDLPGMTLDLGGIAKGFILDQAMIALRQHAPAALIEAGGDILTGDPPPGKTGWRIEVPVGDTAFTRLASALHGGALSTSGPAAQSADIGGRRYSHVIDPATGIALTSGVSAYVIAKDAMTADAVATALTVLPTARYSGFLARVPGVVAYHIQ
jgi:FAD:protein FMN transferase